VINLIIPFLSFFLFSFYSFEQVRGVLRPYAFAFLKKYLEVYFMKASTGIILTMAGFVCGAVLGFVLSPVKDGIRIGTLSFDCNAGCNNGAGNTNNMYGRKGEKKLESEIESAE